VPDPINALPHTAGRGPAKARPLGWIAIGMSTLLTVLLGVGTAAALAASQGTGGYPWANAKPGGEDDVGMRVRECESYVNWKLRQKGIPVERAFHTDPRSARDNFEVVDGTPAPGAVQLSSPPNSTGHVAYVESVDHDAGTMVLSDYNGLGGALQYGIGTVPIPDEAFMARRRIRFVHFELPAVAGGKFINARRMSGQRRMLSNRSLFEENKFTMSPNERFILMLDPTGTLAVYDRDDNFRVTWQLKVKRRAELEMFILGKGRKAKLVLEEAKSWKRLKSWYVGAARKIQLNNAGGLAGIRGGKVVWRAANLNQVPKVARAAERRARLVRSAA
jgi:surface antigen